MSLTVSFSRLVSKTNRYFAPFFLTVKSYLEQASPSQLTRVSLACLLPAGLFWLGTAIYLLGRNTIILDLLFNNHFLGYSTVVGLPIVSGFLSLLSWRRQPRGLSGIGLFLAGLSLFLLLVMIAWP